MVIQVEMRGWNGTRSSNLRNLGEPQMDTQQRHKEGYGLYKPKPLPLFFILALGLPQKKMAASFFFFPPIVEKSSSHLIKKMPYETVNFHSFFSILNLPTLSS